MPIPLIALGIAAAGGEGPIKDPGGIKLIASFFGRHNQDKLDDTQIQEAFSREWLKAVQPKVRIVRGKDPGFVSPEEACDLIAVGDRNAAATLAAFVRPESRAAWMTFPFPGAIWAEWKADLQKRCSESRTAGAGAGTFTGPGVEGATGGGLFASFLPGILPTAKPGEFPLVPVVVLGVSAVLLVVFLLGLRRRK